MIKINKKVYVCSPYRADTPEQFNQQLEYTKKVSRMVVVNGFDVIVPHLYYPLFLDDDYPEDRGLGMASALSLLDVCDYLFVYIGSGVSQGMEVEIGLAKEKDMDIRYFSSMSQLKDRIKRCQTQN